MAKLVKKRPKSSKNCKKNINKIKMLHDKKVPFLRLVLALTNKLIFKDLFFEKSP